MHLFYPPTPPPPPSSPPKKNCIGTALDFSWYILVSRERLQTMIMQFVFGGLEEVYYGICARKEFLFGSPRPRRDLAALSHHHR